METFWQRYPFVKPLLIVLGILLLFMVFNPLSCVPASDRGIRVRFGAVVGDTISPGLVLRAPLIEGIRKYSIQPQQVKVLIPAGPQGAITKDNQTVGVEIQMFYRYKDASIGEIARKYSEEKLRSIATYTAESSTKAVIGTYTIFDIAATQVEVASKVIEMIKAYTVQYPFELVDVKLTNYDWSDDFDRQISLTMEKAQQVKQSEQELQITQINSQKKVKEAEAERASAIALAEGDKAAAITIAEGNKQRVILEAEAKAAEGEGIRKYNQSIAATLDIQLKLRTLDIELERVKRWNGQYVPNNMYGPIPINTQGGISGK